MKIGIQEAIFNTWQLDAELPGLVIGGLHYDRAPQGQLGPYAVYRFDRSLEAATFTEDIEDNAFTVMVFSDASSSVECSTILERVRKAFRHLTILPSGFCTVSFRYYTGMDPYRNDEINRWEGYVTFRFFSQRP